MKINTTKKIVSLLTALVLLVSWMPLRTFAYNSNDRQVSSWNVTDDGDHITITFSGKADNAWYSNFTCDVGYSGTKAGTLNFTLRPADQAGSIYYNWGAVPGSTVNVQGDSSGTYSATITIPKDFFGQENFDLTFCGTTVNSSEFSNSNPGTDPDPGQKPDPDPQPPVNPPSGNRVQGKIVVDGKLDDWANVSGYPGGPAKDQLTYDGWKITRDEAGNLYFCAWGTASSQWASPQWDNINITQSGRYDGKIELGKITNAPVNGRVSIVNEANANTPGPFYVEAMIPASFLTDPDFIFSFGNLDIPASNIEVVDGTEAPPKVEDPVYDGIVIDGEYHDWDAVTKYPASDDNNTNGFNNLDSAAMVFDGDMVYIYLKESPGGNAANAGSHGNGRYSIVTDLGYELVFQINLDGSISGINGVTAAHVGSEWEIAIPASELPQYLETISFGLYQQEPPFVEDVANLDGSVSGGTFDGIVYDGEYDDWDYYPHTRIDYSTAGTHEDVLDAEGALWFDGDHTLFGHFFSSMPAHVARGVYELTHAITFRFNGGEYIFEPRMLGGTYEDTDWHPDFDNMPNGTYEFLMVELHGWNDQWEDWQGNPVNTIYGKMMVTKTDDRIECEFYLDLEELAAFFGCDADDFKLIEAQFGQLGKEWVSYAGASSGAAMGIVICVLFVGIVLFLDKRKNIGGIKQ